MWVKVDGKAERQGKHEVATISSAAPPVRYFGASLTSSVNSCTFGFRWESLLTSRPTTSLALLVPDEIQVRTARQPGPTQSLSDGQQATTHLACSSPGRSPTLSHIWRLMSHASATRSSAVALAAGPGRVERSEAGRDVVRSISRRNELQ